VSSSGLIYAGIVGAWAVYLVPVWLRREEQLNTEREKARYAAAIRTLGRPEQFEKRWAQDEELAATGTDGPVRVPGSGSKTAASNTSKKSTQTPSSAPSTGDAATDARTDSTTGDDAGTRTRPQGPAKPALRAVRAARGGNGAKGAKATVRIDAGGAAEGVRTRPSAPVQAGRTPGKVLAASQRTRQTVTARLSTAERASVKHRGTLLMRRRRVVAFLFVLSTLGATLSAVLGVGYIAAMLAPATLMSLYIVKIRRDERARARERFRRRQAQLAAERRRDRERALVEAQAAVQDAEHDAPVWRPTVEPGDFRRAANS
jgi:hypothetical protein